MLIPPAPGEPYGRTPLPVPPGADEELLAMTWRDGATCAPHDHGDAGGHVTLIRGALTETTFAFSTDDPRGLVPIGSRTLHAPAILDVEPGRIHAMTAHGDALTIHRYTPRIHGMRVYDTARRRTLIVRDDCGAWIPSDPDLIVDIESWLGDDGGTR